MLTKEIQTEILIFSSQILNELCGIYMGIPNSMIKVHAR
jgi:hypothetical protein